MWASTPTNGGRGGLLYKNRFFSYSYLRKSFILRNVMFLKIYRLVLLSSH
jgi:hypothetical protein